jgi:hypothetical protein
MALSGVTTWQLTLTQIVDAALRKISMIGDGVTATTTQKTAATQALNAMLKSFASKGMPLWQISEYSFPLTATRSYSIGIGQTLAVPAPLKIIQAYQKDTTAIDSVPLNIVTHYDYNEMLPTSTNTGTPVNLLYLPGNQVGTIKIWPMPDAYSIANRQITITYQTPVQDMVSDTDNLDFPQNWTEAIIYGLAWRLAPEYGVPPNDLKAMANTAQLFLDDALSFGTEEGSITFMPDWVGRR